jgi:polyhydroxyalkanoate synthesis regulator phasin
MAESPDDKSSASKQSTEPGDEARADKSVQAFRDALEKSVTLSRDRLQEVVDDAVARGRITRDDANELVSRLVARSRQQTESMLRDLERLLGQARDRLR